MQFLNLSTRPILITILAMFIWSYDVQVQEILFLDLNLVFQIHQVQEILFLENFQALEIH